MIERNAGVPTNRIIEFRIGIHLGDVVEETDGDLMGDGVNIAARLEALAAPGDICLSEDAYRQVKARIDFTVSELGETHFKNIAEPMRVYLLQVGTVGSRKESAIVEPAIASPTVAGPPKLSIAVLPFTNMSGDAEQDYFAHGISEDIITALPSSRSCSSYLAILRSRSKEGMYTCRKLARASACATSWRAACASPAIGCGSPRS